MSVNIKEVREYFCEGEMSLKKCREYFGFKEPVAKIRMCLRCRKSFHSQWEGNRMCRRCKYSSHYDLLGDESEGPVSL